MIYGSFFSRFKAFIIDYLIIAIPLSILWYVLKIPIPQPNYTIGNFLIFSSPFAWLVSIIYYGIMESGPNQATFGKKMMNLKVVDKNGEPVSFIKANARTLNKFFSSILLLGYLMYFMNKRKQTFHDWVTNCIVIENENIAEVTKANNV
jgi:uncharacterized RDD family membrane protein YckC